MKRAVKSIFVIVLAVSLVFSSFAVCFAADIFSVEVPVTFQQTKARSMLAMINDFRASDDAWYWAENNTDKVICSNLSAYEYDYNLEQVAMQRAVEVALTFEHTRPDGSTCFTAYTSGYGSKGENIAAGYTSAAAAFEGWQEANYQYSGQGHRRNMLSTNKVIGIACVYYNGKYFWVQEFSNVNLGSTETPVNDGTANVPVDILGSKITSKTVTVKPDTISFKEGATADVPAVSAKVTLDGTWGSNCPINVVAEWNLADESIAAIENGKLAAKSCGETTLSAVIFGETVTVPVEVKKNAAVVTFNAAGGTVTPETAEFAPNEAVDFPTPEKSGFTFLGWAKSETAAEPEYKAGDECFVTEDTTFFAVWQDNAEIKAAAIAEIEAAAADYDNDIAAAAAEEAIAAINAAETLEEIEAAKADGLAKIYDSKCEIDNINVLSVTAVGEIAELEITTIKPVKKIQFADANGSTTTYTADSAKTVSVVNNDDGTQVWTVQLTVRHSVDEYTVKAKERSSGGWSDKTYDLTIEVPAPVVADEIISVEFPDAEDGKIKYGTHDVIITTGKEVSKVQIAYAGTTATYSKSSTKATVTEDEDTLVWTISLNFYKKAVVNYGFSSRSFTGTWKTSDITETIETYKTNDVSEEKPR